MLEKVRIDKWLWSVRIFKSRSLATKVIQAGKVRINEKTVKPSYLVKRGERILVSKNGFDFQFEVVDLIQKRVGAPLAVKCYVDHTPAEELNKFKDWYIGKRGAEVREKGTGRPTKRERRDIDEFKEKEFYDWEDE